MRLVEIGKSKEESPLATLADDIERNELGWKEWAYSHHLAASPIQQMGKTPCQ